MMPDVRLSANRGGPQTQATHVELGANRLILLNSFRRGSLSFGVLVAYTSVYSEEFIMTLINF